MRRGAAGAAGFGACVLHHKKRDKSAALLFLKKALKRRDKVEVIVTDGRRSCSAAMHELAVSAAGSLSVEPDLATIGEDLSVAGTMRHAQGV